MEDSRIIGDCNNDVAEWSIRSIGNVSGKEHTFKMNPSQLEDCLAMVFNLDGEPAIRTLDERYANVESLFVNCPQECRFIP